MPIDWDAFDKKYGLGDEEDSATTADAPAAEPPPPPTIGPDPQMRASMYGDSIVQGIDSSPGWLTDTFGKPNPLGDRMLKTPEERDKIALAEVDLAMQEVHQDRLRSLMEVTPPELPGEVTPLEDLTAELITLPEELAMTARAATKAGILAQPVTAGVAGLAKAILTSAAGVVEALGRFLPGDANYADRDGGSVTGAIMDFADAIGNVAAKANEDQLQASIELLREGKTAEFYAASIFKSLGDVLGNVAVQAKIMRGINALLGLGPATIAGMTWKQKMLKVGAFGLMQGIINQGDKTERIKKGILGAVFASTDQFTVPYGSGPAGTFVKELALNTLITSLRWSPEKAMFKLGGVYEEAEERAYDMAEAAGASDVTPFLIMEMMNVFSSDVGFSMLAALDKKRIMYEKIRSAEGEERAKVGFGKMVDDELAKAKVARETDPKWEGLRVQEAMLNDTVTEAERRRPPEYMLSEDRRMAMAIGEAVPYEPAAMRAALGFGGKVSDEEASAVGALADSIGIDVGRVRVGLGVEPEAPPSGVVREQMGGRLAATANIGNVDRAVEMEKAGIAPEQIRSETGWERVLEGEKLMFEIDDSVIPKRDGEFVGKLGELLPTSSPVFLAYPQLREYNVNYSALPDRRGGGKLIQSTPEGMSEKLTSGVPYIEAWGKNVSAARKLLAHEIQHAIQEIEGFRRGGTPEAMSKSVLQQNINRASWIDDLRRARSIIARVGPTTEGVMSSSKEEQTAAMAAFDDTKNKWMTVSEIDAAIEKIQRDIDTEDLTGYEGYLNLTGEAMSRVAAIRLDMTPEQRKATPIRETLISMLNNEGLLKEGQRPEDVLINRGGSVRGQQGGAKGQPVVKGTTELLDGGKAIVRFYEAADLSTGVHEIYHVAEHQIVLGTDDFAIQARAKHGLTDKDVAYYKTWAGYDVAKTEAELTAASEKATKAFETYLSNGYAPTSGLRSIFSKIKTWMSAIYKGLKGSPVDAKLDQGMRRIYDKLLTTPEEREPPTGHPTLSNEALANKLRTILSEEEHSEQGRRKFGQYLRMIETDTRTFTSMKTPEEVGAALGIKHPAKSKTVTAVMKAIDNLLELPSDAHAFDVGAIEHAITPEGKVLLAKRSDSLKDPDAAANLAARAKALSEIEERGEVWEPGFRDRFLKDALDAGEAIAMATGEDVQPLFRMHENGKLAMLGEKRRMIEKVEEIAPDPLAFLQDKDPRVAPELIVKAIKTGDTSAFPERHKRMIEYLRDLDRTVSRYQTKITRIYKDVVRGETEEGDPHKEVLAPLRESYKAAVRQGRIQNSEAPVLEWWQTVDAWCRKTGTPEKPEESDKLIRLDYYPSLKKPKDGDVANQWMFAGRAIDDAHADKGDPLWIESIPFLHTRAPQAPDKLTEHPYLVMLRHAMKVSRVFHMYPVSTMMWAKLVEGKHADGSFANRRSERTGKAQRIVNDRGKEAITHLLQEAVGLGRHPLMEGGMADTARHVIDNVANRFYRSGAISIGQKQTLQFLHAANVDYLRPIDLAPLNIQERNMPKELDSITNGDKDLSEMIARVWDEQVKLGKQELLLLDPKENKSFWIHHWRLANGLEPAGPHSAWPTTKTTRPSALRTRTAELLHLPAKARYIPLWLVDIGADNVLLKMFDKLEDGVARTATLGRSEKLTDIPERGDAAVRLPNFMQWLRAGADIIINQKAPFAEIAKRMEFGRFTESERADIARKLADGDRWGAVLDIAKTHTRVGNYRYRPGMRSFAELDERYTPYMKFMTWMRGFTTHYMRLLNSSFGKKTMPAMNVVEQKKEHIQSLILLMMHAGAASAVWQLWSGRTTVSEDDPNFAEEVIKRSILSGEAGSLATITQPGEMAREFLMDRDIPLVGVGYAADVGKASFYGASAAADAWHYYMLGPHDYKTRKSLERKIDHKVKQVLRFFHQTWKSFNLSYKITSNIMDASMGAHNVNIPMLAAERMLRDQPWWKEYEPEEFEQGFWDIARSLMSTQKPLREKLENQK